MPRRASIRALKCDPDYVQALIGLGEAEAMLGDRASALKRFETAIEIDPYRPHAHFCKGRLLEATGQTDQAMAEYFRALEFDPNNAETSLRIAALQLARNQPDQALARLDQVVELAAQNAEARLVRGRAYLALGYIPQAIADLRSAATQMPDQPQVHYYLALALEADRKPAEALGAAQQALRLAPDDPAPAGSRNGWHSPWQAPARQNESPTPFQPATGRTSPSPSPPGDWNSTPARARREGFARARSRPFRLPCLSPCSQLAPSAR